MLKLLGASTGGEISTRGLLKNSTVISISYFIDTKIETNIIEYHHNSYFDMGAELLNKFSKEAKLLISFASGLTTNGELYLDGISSVDKHLIVSGGLAGDNSKFEQTIAFTEDTITTNGAVGACFYNKDLNVATDYSFHWQTLGKKHIVTKSTDNRVYTIGDRTAVDFYAYYLGETASKLLTIIISEFTLVIKKDGLNIGRTVLAKYDDGSLSFAGNIPEGSEIQFGYGDVQMIIENSLKNIKSMKNTNAESIFIYSCSGRAGFLKEDINSEILPLNEIAPISGFFTYGEFFHACKKDTCQSELLNQTMTILAISEAKINNNLSNVKVKNNEYELNKLNMQRTQALSSLMKRTTDELEEFNVMLDDMVKVEVKKNLKKDTIIKTIQTQAQMGEMLEMIIHQWRQPLGAISVLSSGAQFTNKLSRLSSDDIDDKFGQILNFTNNLNDTIEDFRDFFKSVASLTEINISSLIQKSITVSNSLLKKHNIELIIDNTNDKMVSVPVSLLMQVIVNIIKNSIDILLENKILQSQIKIQIITNKESFIIRIMDNGGGIPEEILEKVFDKKFTTKKSEGTGIGLHMSKTIIEEKLLGKLSAYNDGQWAIFDIQLPYVISVNDL